MIALAVQRRLAGVPADGLLAWVAAAPPAPLFRAWGPIPGVAAVEAQTGPWDRAGQRRTLRLTDGGRTVEELLDFAPPARFRYRMSGFGRPLDRLVTAIDGKWWCVPLPGGAVRLGWRYRFHDRGIAARVVLWLMAMLFWRAYMHASIDRVAGAAARELGHAPRGNGNSPRL